MRICENLRRFREHCGIDSSALTLTPNFITCAGSKKRFDGRFPLCTNLRIECGAVIGIPVGSAQWIRYVLFVHPIAERTVRRRTEAASHQCVKAITIGERPNASYGCSAVIQRPADTMQFGPTKCHASVPFTLRENATSCTATSMC